MNPKNGNSPQGYDAYFKVIAYICRQDIYYAMRNRINLFSRVKSGKFSSDENKLTIPTITLWRGLLLISVHRFTRAYTIK